MADEDFDVEAAAAEHHARLMGRDLPLEERRARARELGTGSPVSGEDRELLAHWSDGPGARPTEADRKRWVELAKTMPRSYRCPECRLLHRVGENPHD